MTSAAESLTIEAVTHRFPGLVAVDDVNLDIKGGELVALLGPSGCGKTTLLRIIAGFIAQSEGRILFAGHSVDQKPPGERGVGIVFQNYALFPHMTVAQNIGYGLGARGVARTARDERVAEMLSLVRLEGFGNRYPGQLSGGQQQRVALVRALAVGPSVLLLDEPFAALDKNLRLDLQIEIRRIQRLAGITTVLVTHDQEEALSMADRVAVLNKGRLEQFARPTDVYDHPASLFVSSFVGTTNRMSGRVVSAAGARATITLCQDVRIEAAMDQSVTPGDAVIVCARPEHLEMTDSASQGSFRGVVETGFPLGAALLHDVRLADGSRLKISEPRRIDGVPRPPGTEIGIRLREPAVVSAFRAQA
jgi:putative spermidine/putrescine transport system ATP-binding protein